MPSQSPILLHIFSTRHTSWNELSNKKPRARASVYEIEKLINLILMKIESFCSICCLKKCYMYCLWEQFGLVDEKQELSLSGMLTFFQRIPAYRQEVQKAIMECKALGNTFGICCQIFYFASFFLFIPIDRLFTSHFAIFSIVFVYFL